MADNVTRQRTVAGVLLTAVVALGWYWVSRSRKRKADSRLQKRRGSNFRIIEESVSKKGTVVETVPLDVGSFTTLGLEQPIVIAMVGLPARGKSYIVKMMVRYFSWGGFHIQVFNVGQFRREMGLQGADAAFFSAANEEGAKLREELAMKVQENMYRWLYAGRGEQRIAIFDATNTTIARRQALANRARRENVFLLFVESICDDDEVLQRNYDLKLLNEDYKNVDPVKAKVDFIQRVKAYEKVYETIADFEDSNKISYIKLVNVGQKVISRNCFGYVPSQVAFYLQNVHIHPRKIYLSLNAEEHVERAGGTCIGVDTGTLTEAGRDYSLQLAKYIELERQQMSDELGKDFLTLTGTSKVDSETILHLRMMCLCFTTPLLNELRAGDFQGLTVEEIKTKFHEEHEKRNLNKLQYRYPGVGGESYLDVIERIRPVIIELERQRRSLLVVCHIAVLRCIYAYFMGTEVEKIPFIPIKPHEVIELTPGPFGTQFKVVDVSRS